MSHPIAEALARRRARRDPDRPLVFHRDGIPVRRWRTAWRTACQAAGVPTRFLHDCRRTAARNLIRASVPERVAILLTGHKTRASFDRYNIINEQELLDASDQLVAYLAQHAQATPRGGRPHPARTAAAGRGAAGSPDTARLGAADRALATHDGAARDRGTRSDEAGPPPPTGTCRQWQRAAGRPVVQVQIAHRQDPVRRRVAVADEGRQVRHDPMCRASRRCQPTGSFSADARAGRHADRLTPATGGARDTGHERPTGQQPN